MSIWHILFDSLGTLKRNYYTYLKFLSTYYLLKYA